MYWKYFNHISSLYSRMIKIFNHRHLIRFDRWNTALVQCRRQCYINKYIKSSSDGSNSCLCWHMRGELRRRSILMEHTMGKPIFSITSNRDLVFLYLFLFFSVIKSILVTFRVYWISLLFMLRLWVDSGWLSAKKGMT